MGKRTEMTGEDLRVWFRTGRSFVISGTGKDRKYGYRRGVKCNAGDLDVSEWVQKVKALIRLSGEQELFDSLYKFMVQHNYCRASKSELEGEALELYVSRVFDNEAWVHFVEFNRLHRPEALLGAQLRLVKTECCSKLGWVTEKRVALAGGEGGCVPCPNCGKWSAFVFVRGDDEGVDSLSYEACCV